MVTTYLFFVISLMGGISFGAGICISPLIFLGFQLFGKSQKNQASCILTFFLTSTIYIITAWVYFLFISIFFSPQNTVALTWVQVGTHTSTSYETMKTSCLTVGPPFTLITSAYTLLFHIRSSPASQYSIRSDRNLNTHGSLLTEHRERLILGRTNWAKNSCNPV